MRLLQLDSYQDLGFEEHFKKVFGTHGRASIGFGKRGRHVSNPTDISGYFDTPNHVENDVSLSSADSMLMGGDRVLLVSRTPIPTLDSDLVGSREYLQGKGGGRLSMFVNDTSEDPRPPKDFVTGEPLPRPSWMKPGVRIFWRLYRLNTNPGQAYLPMALYYTGTDDPLGERPLHTAPDASLSIDGQLGSMDGKLDEILDILGSKS